MEGIPLPNKDVQEWFLLEFNYALPYFWTEYGLDVEKFKQLILGFDVPDEELLAAVVNKYGYRAARCVRRLEEYLLAQVLISQSGRLN